ncbi:MAG TPA: nucleoside hydrolase [Acidobacteriota bacterium]|nr:nucleoside hydrolase [Acidobacteriota bacterium]
MLCLALIALSFCLAAFQTPQKPPVIVDTDAGTDDLMAISYLLAGGEVDLKAITVVNGLAHVEKGAKNILGLLELAGRRDIPVFIGESHPLAGSASFPEEWRRLSDDFPALELPQSVRSPKGRSAVDYLAEEMRLPPGGPSLRILALGPLTNIARALDANPGRVRGIRSVVIMGGAIRVPGNLGDGGVFKTENKSAEWNMYIDPLAASHVFASGIPIELVPLDATNRVPIDSAFERTFSKKAATPLSRFVSRLFSSERDLIEDHAFYAWDPLAAVVLTHPGVARFEDHHLEIGMKPPSEGQTRVLSNRSPNAMVAADADSAAFTRLFMAAFFPKAPRRH